MKTFSQFLENQGLLFRSLMALRPKIAQAAQAAQAVYDSWEQDEEGFDDEFGGGGICDEISNEIAGIISSIPDSEITDGGQDGDDHSWLIVYNKSEAYGVDIPCQVYERGGGYSWKKVNGVTIRPTDVNIFQVNIPQEGW